MAVVDVLFPVQGTTLPTDHAYPLYAALTGLVPTFHDKSIPLHFAPIRGLWGGKGLIRLGDCSRLRLRLPAEKIRAVLPLAGKAIQMGTHRIRFGVPHTVCLLPAPA